MITSAVSKTWRGKRALSMPEMKFENGKIYAIIGSNGSGKTTYVRMLAGTLESDDKKSPLPAEISVGYLPQNSHAFRMSTKKNIMLGNRDSKNASKNASQNVSEKASELMDVLGIGHLSEQNARRLSGGESARMALARILMGKHRMLILDEPTAAMDMESTLMAEKLIQEYCHNENCCVIMITHSLQQAERLADEVIFLHGGELVEHGPAKQVLHSPEQTLTRRFLEFFGHY